MGLRVQPGVRVGAFCVVASLLALLATAGPAVAKPKPITGKLSKPGYEVIALATSGEATSVRARANGFRLRPSAKRVSLHLRAADGTYAGPVVIGKERKGKWAIVGVRAGAKLGMVEVKATRGYAKLRKRLPEKSLDTEQRARATKGVPIGAGAFGLVRSKLRARVVPGDPDLDGVPNPLDVDDDGDLVLDNLDLPTAEGGARASATEGGCGPGGPGRASSSTATPSTAVWRLQDSRTPSTSTRARPWGRSIRLSGDSPRSGSRP